MNDLFYRLQRGDLVRQTLYIFQNYKLGVLRYIIYIATLNVKSSKSFKTSLIQVGNKIKNASFRNTELENAFLTIFPVNG